MPFPLKHSLKHPLKSLLSAVFFRVRPAAFFAASAAFSALFFTAGAAAEQPGASAAAKANQCIGCHHIPGYKSVFPQVYPVPRIINQSAAYIEYALNAYKVGERTHPSMSGIAAQLSEQDIADLAEFYANGAQ